MEEVLRPVYSGGVSPKGLVGRKDFIREVWRVERFETETK